MPELNIFENVSDRNIAWFLPLWIMVNVYLAQRFKYWYLAEGDIVFDFSEWARNAEARLNYIEKDGALEEENFFFNVSKED